MEDKNIKIVRVSHAAFLIEDLFRRTFVQQPPLTPVHYVAFYHTAPSLFEVIGYYHVDYRPEYALVGGLCVDARFRNRGLGEEFSKVVFADAGERKAFFCHVGNPVSQAIARRVGYSETRQEYLMVKWMQSLSANEQERIVTEVVALGPF